MAARQLNSGEQPVMAGELNLNGCVIGKKLHNVTAGEQPTMSGCAIAQRDGVGDLNDILCKLYIDYLKSGLNISFKDYANDFVVYEEAGGKMTYEK